MGFSIMDYDKLLATILPKLLAAVKLINNPEVDPELRQLNQEILFRSVGLAVYNKIYDMSAFDFGVPESRGEGIDDRHYGLAKAASNSISTGDIALGDLVRNYVHNMSGMAQQHAFTTARQAGKHPTVTRTESADACKWCQSKVGKWENPDASIFARHAGCTGVIVTEGYKSRNGLLKNYKKDG